MTAERSVRRGRRRQLSLQAMIRWLVLVPALFPLALGYVMLTADLAPLALLILTGLAAFSVTTGLFGLWLTRRFLAVLDEAARGMEEVAGGGSGRLRMPPFIELASLTDSFNSMASQLQRSQRNLVRQAFHDPLTGLPNRAHFLSRLGQALNRRSQSGGLAAPFVDLDRFKVVNDSLGHAMGDNLLTVVAARLEHSAGPEALVARFGGDEFTALIEGPDAHERAVVLAEAVLRSMQRPMALDGHELFVNASVGIALADGTVTNSTEVLRRADIALYQAKAQGRGMYVIFDPAVHDFDIQHIDLEAGMRRAIERGQLELLFQPEVDVIAGRVRGMEGLIRWNHPQLGQLGPAEFLPLAEEIGEITQIGQWALVEACTAAVEFARRVEAARDLVVGVNLSASEFRDPSLPGRVREVLAITGLPAHRLRLELTEDVLITNVELTVRTLDLLRALGVQVAIDDFGTGYSSLSYLHNFHVTTLKIDESFVRRVGDDPRAGPIIDAIVDLAGALDMDVTAEGVETARQAEAIARAGCRRAQGNFFARPLSAAAFERFVTEFHLAEIAA